MKRNRFLLQTFCAPLCMVAALTGFLAVSSAKADTGFSTTAARGLQEALASRTNAKLYEDAGQSGLSIGGNFFSGRAMGTGPVTTGFFNDEMNGRAFDRDSPAELVGDQRMYALLIDGSYDFDTGLPLRPYVAGGVGMAMYGPGAATGGNLGMQSGDMVPLFRIGGGVTYKLGDDWNLSLDYKAGFSGVSQQIVTGQQPADMQMLNMGMHFKF